MDPERWQTVQDILLHALELEPGKRPAYLDDACSDTEIRREVESLLGAETAVVRGLDQPAVDLLADTEQEPGTSSDLKSGGRIGPYRLQREIGRGGMGTVWLAVRDDQEFERRVAIKVLKRGMDTDEIVRRFRLERQILANLEHPHVAELYEGGTTDDHRPYFVMEYVDGLPIDRYCDHHALAVGERLALFRKVCGAVQFLHRNLVVHRDLKPSNILVTAEGEPKLLDFGIAKLLDPTSLRPLTLTEPGWRPMTPEYASPEQVCGGPITTASDVYALGVLLYELLTGHRPYRLPSRVEAEIVRVICEVEPSAPSAAVTRTEEVRTAAGDTVTIDPETVGRVRRQRPAKLRRRLAGDLDNIVLMALRKEPERRYPSVALLAEDLDRHSKGLPVRAHRSSLAYRAGKLLRRRWREAVVALVLVFLSSVSVANYFAQQRRVAEERDQALRVTRFLTELFQDSDPYLRQDTELTAESLLERGAARLEQEPDLEPEIRAALLRTLGDINRRLARFDRAEAQLEEALELRRGIQGGESFQMAEALASLAALRADQGALEEAEQGYRKAVEIARQEGSRAEAELASWLNALALVLQGRSDYQDAEILHREGLAIQQRLFGDDHPEVALILGDLALMHHHRGGLEVSETLYRRALAIERRHFGPRHPRIEEVVGNLAMVLMSRGRNAEAEPLLREALDIARTTLGPDHPSVARNANNLAAVRRKLGDLDEAESLFRQALGTARRAYGDDHPNVARTMNGLAGVLQQRGALETAESLLRDSLDILRRQLGPGHPGVASTSALLARAILEKGDPASAERLIREALQIFRQRLGPEHDRSALAEQILGACLSAQGRWAEAEPLLVESYLRLVAIRGVDDPESLRAREEIVDLYMAWGRPERADAYR